VVGGMPKNVLVIGLFCSCFVFASCRDSMTNRTQPDVWEANPYIPKTLAAADYAQLDLETACVLRFRNDDIGYIRFKKADKWHAQYESAFLTTTNDLISYRSSVTDGLVRLGGETPTVLCGDIPVRWGPPTTIFFSEDMTHVALVPIDSLKAGKPEFTNELSWLSVNVPPL
jgi:hypothetical protein